MLDDVAIPGGVPPIVMGEQEVRQAPPAEALGVHRGVQRWFSLTRDQRPKRDHPVALHVCGPVAGQLPAIEPPQRGGQQPDEPGKSAWAEQEIRRC